MKGKRYTTEEKIRILREADKGKAITEVCREHNLSQVTFHRWKKQFGQMEVNEARRLKDLEQRIEAFRRQLEARVRNTIKYAERGAQGLVGRAGDLVRRFVGPDWRWIMAYSTLAAPALLLAADVLGRVVVRPAELPAGIVTAFLGAPVLIWVIRRRGAWQR